MPTVVSTATSDEPISSHIANRSVALRARYSGLMRLRPKARPPSAKAKRGHGHRQTRGFPGIAQSRSRGKGRRRGFGFQHHTGIIQRGFQRRRAGEQRRYILAARGEHVQTIGHTAHIGHHQLGGFALGQLGRIDQAERLGFQKQRLCQAAKPRSARTRARRSAKR